MFILPAYNQLDPRWRSKRLGTTGNTIGSHGCTVTGLAMFLRRFGIEETPATVVDKLNAVGGLLPSGDLIWYFVEIVWPSIHFIWRQYTTLESPSYANRRPMAATLQQIHRLIALGQPVLINVDGVFADGRPDHWVLAYDTPGGSSGEFIINDPNGGRNYAFSTRYGNPLNGIYGYAVLVGNTAYFPPWSAEQRDGSALWKAAEIADGYNVNVYAKEIIQDLIG